MADAKDFLFEIGTEEMPSAPLNNAVKQLGTMIAKGLDEAGLAHGEVRVISSPRRLAALVADVATATDEVHEVKRGPAANIAFDADGNATKAAQGFARKCGVAAEDLVRREDTDGREYVFAEKNISATPINFTEEEILERFVRGDKSRTDGGSGLGLSISKSFTEACGGIFNIEIDGDMFKAIVEMPIIQEDTAEKTDDKTE